jgi:hypothetical protein
LRTEFARFSASFLAECDRLAANLAAPVSPDAGYGDPLDPRNKVVVGNNLTPRGVEVAYRMFDADASRYKVAKDMQISFGAASYRLDTWTKAGSKSRTRMPLDD